MLREFLHYVFCLSYTWTSSKLCFNTHNPSETVILPVKIQTIESKSFINCDNLINFYYLSTSKIGSADAVTECLSLNEIKVNVNYTGNKEMKINDKIVSLVLTPGTFGNEQKPMRYFYDASKDLYELIIYGEGVMIDFTSSTDQPWNVFNSQMKKYILKKE